MHLKLKTVNKKSRVGAVSYLNAKPLVYGFEKGLMQDSIHLSFDFPSKIAYQLIHDEIDIGLIPVAAIPHLKEYHIISDFCIGTDGEVASVCLFSDVPLQNIESVLLDYQSRTSVMLLQILLKEYWRVSPNIIISESGYESKISGTTAGLVIGDRAFIQRKKSKFHFDLGLAWKEMTGLPFVFAAWVSNKKLSDLFIKNFNDATSLGLSHKKEISTSIPYGEYDLLKYYEDNISYELNLSKRNALKLFLEKTAQF